MARLTHEGTQVYWVDEFVATDPGIEDIAAPTTAEIAAGIRLDDQITADGLGTTPTQNKASGAALGDAFVGENVGTFSTGMTLTFFRDPDPGESYEDAAWDLLEYGKRGYIVVDRFAKLRGGDALSAGDPVEVYPVESHDPAPAASAENERQRFSVELAVHMRPALDAVVAAAT